jgi:alpha-1,4-N-acetylglucosaminyltransferase EXTL3
MTLCDPIFKMRLSRLLIVIVVVLVTMPLIIHHFLSGVDRSLNGKFQLESIDPELARNKLRLMDLDGLSGEELKVRIDDLLRIKHSVLTELRYIEKDRAEKLKQKSEMDRLIEKLKAQATREQSELERLGVSIGQAKMLQKELAERNNPEVLPPLQLHSLPENNYIASSPGADKKDFCTMGKCFDLARCPLSSGFPVYFYPSSSESNWILDGDGFGYRSNSPETACLFVAIINASFSDFDKELRYWRGDGRNHLLVDSSSFREDDHSLILQKPSKPINTGKAMLASTTVLFGQKFRPRFDLLLPSFASRIPSPGDPFLSILQIASHLVLKSQYFGFNI